MIVHSKHIDYRLFEGMGITREEMCSSTLGELGTIPQPRSLKRIQPIVNKILRAIPDFMRRRNGRIARQIRREMAAK
jgi:hypothetical protein